MRRIIVVTALLLALTVGYTGARFMAHERMSKGGESGDLLGASVKNPQGENLGTITDVATGPEGRDAFAILSFWISDDTQKQVAIPIGTLSCEAKKCVLDMSRDALDSAPIFVPEDDLSEPEVAADIYRYFGVQPYWTEEDTEKPKL